MGGAFLLLGKKKRAPERSLSGAVSFSSITAKEQKLFSGYFVKVHEMEGSLATLGFPPKRSSF